MWNIFNILFLKKKYIFNIIAFSQKKSKGFTLFELIVVITLIALGSSMVFINIGKSKLVSESKDFSRKMISLCRKSRRISVHQGKMSVFNISSGDRICWIDENKDGSIEIPEDLLIEGEGVMQLNDDVYAIWFYPDGSSSGGTLTLSAEDNIIAVLRIDIITGLITLVKDNQEQ